MKFTIGIKWMILCGVYGAKNIIGTTYITNAKKNISIGFIPFGYYGSIYFFGIGFKYVLILFG